MGSVGGDSHQGGRHPRGPAGGSVRPVAGDGGRKPFRRFCVRVRHPEPRIISAAPQMRAFAGQMTAYATKARPAEGGIEEKLFVVLWRNQTHLEQIQPKQLSTGSNWNQCEQRGAELSSSRDFVVAGRCFHVLIERMR